MSLLDLFKPRRAATKSAGSRIVRKQGEYKLPEKRRLQMKEASKRWREKNREAHRAASRAYYHAHREECKQRKAEWDRKNRALINARRRAWRSLKAAKSSQESTRN